MEQKSTQGILVSKKTEELLNMIYPALGNFPNSEKFALSEHIRVGLIEVIGNVEMAVSVKSKRVEYAQTADGHLQKVKVMIRLAKNRKYISLGLYREVDSELTEINKLLSSFIRATFRK